MRHSIKTTAKIALFLLLTTLCLSGCTAKPPAESEIAETFTEEFLTEITEQYINYELEVLLVDGVKLLRRQTNEKSDVSDCVIALSNEKYKCEITAMLDYQYYDEGGWQLDNWNIIETKVVPLEGVPDKMVGETHKKLRIIYPDVELISRNLDLETDGLKSSEVLEYSIPHNTTLIGETGIKISEGGIIKSIYTFENFGDGYAWRHTWDDSAATAIWEDYVGRGYPTEELVGTVYLEFNDYTPHSVFEGTLDLTIRYDRGFYLFSEVASERVAVSLSRSPQALKVQDILNPMAITYIGNEDFAAAKCKYYGHFSYPRNSSGENCYGFIALTDKGVFFAEKGEYRTDTKGNKYIHYNWVSKYV